MLEIIRRKIADENVIWLIKEILQSYCGKDKSGYGLPLGNATSQLFANIYLNGLDHFVKERLGMRWYIRFCDDFIILHRSPAVLKDALLEIRPYLLEERGLELHPKKISIGKLSYGVDFVGQVLRPHYRVLRTKTKRRMFCRIDAFTSALQNKKITLETFRQSLQSYKGLLSNGANYSANKKVQETILRKFHC